MQEKALCRGRMARRETETGSVGRKGKMQAKGDHAHHLMGCREIGHGSVMLCHHLPTAPFVGFLLPAF